MTTHLPLDSSSLLPTLNASVVVCPNPVAKLKDAIQAVVRAERIVVICGMWVSELNQAHLLY